MRFLSLLKIFFTYYKRFGVRGLQLIIDEKLINAGEYEFRSSEFKFPITLRNATSDFHTFNQVIFDKCYDTGYGLNPKTIIDCGANIGLASIYFKTMFPDATVIAVEPEAENYKLLCRNISSYPNIHTLNGGIWSTSSNLRIKDEGLGSWSFSVEEVDYEDDTTVKAYSIPDIMQQFNISTIDILKIDIEGSEKELFSKNMEQWLPFTKTIIIEMHDWMNNGGGAKAVFSAICHYDFYFLLRGENLYFFLNRK
jgi:FkbM family methyltransferase